MSDSCNSSTSYLAEHLLQLSESMKWYCYVSCILCPHREDICAECRYAKFAAVWKTGVGSSVDPRTNKKVTFLVPSRSEKFGLGCFFCAWYAQHSERATSRRCRGRTKWVAWPRLSAFLAQKVVIFQCEFFAHEIGQALSAVCGIKSMQSSAIALHAQSQIHRLAVRV